MTETINFAAHGKDSESPENLKPESEEQVFFFDFLILLNIAARHMLILH